MLGTFAEDAVFDVVGEQKEPKLVQRGAKGGHLGENIDAIALFVDHLLDSADLSRNSGETLLSVSIDVVTH
jgi:hypothetical protein